MIEQVTNEAISLLRRLIATPSLSSQEGDAADLMASFLTSQGHSPYRISHNVWAIAEPWKPDIPAILLNSHLDTVPPNPGYTRNAYEPMQEEGRLYGLGSTDAGASLVSLAATFLVMADWKERPFNLVFAATAEEETSGKNGITALLSASEFREKTHGAFAIRDEHAESEQAGQAQMNTPSVHPLTCAIVGEPTQMQLAVAERGLMVIDAVAHGVSGHAARKEGKNAIMTAMDDIAWLQANHMPKVSEFLGPVTWTPTTIHTPNTRHNVVPDRCEFTIDIRIHEGYTHEEVLATLWQHLKSELTPRSFNLRSSLIAPYHPLVKTGLELGRQPYGSPTSSDKGRLAFPALKMGPGDSARSHTADEYIELDEIRDGIQLYIDLLKRVHFEPFDPAKPNTDS